MLKQAIRNYLNALTVIKKHYCTVTQGAERVAAKLNGMIKKQRTGHS